MYHVYLGCERIGTLDLQKEGLYYKLHCSCRLTGQIVHILVATSDSGRVNLGTLVPEAGFFCLRTRLPIKKLSLQNLKFTVEPKHPQNMQLFVPIRAEEPFSYLDRLNSACLCTKGMQIGVVVAAREDHSDSSRPTGQWSEPNISE